MYRYIFNSTKISSANQDALVYLFSYPFFHLTSDVFRYAEFIAFSPP